MVATNEVVIKVRLDSGNVKDQISEFIRELEKLNNVRPGGLKNSSEDVTRLAQSLSVSYKEAQKFSTNIGLTASKTDEALVKLRGLTEVNASNATKFRVLSSELGITRKQFDELSKVTGRSTETLTEIGVAAGGISVGLGAIAVQGIRAFADFEKAVNTFGVVTQSTGTQALRDLRSEIEGLAASTTKTPQEIANVSVELGKAGFTAEQTKVALAGVVLASEATGESLQRTGEVVGSTLTQFGLAADESGRIADLLTTASNASNAGTDDLGEALSYVGTQARASNQSVEDTITTLGQLANAGIKGSSAGTGLAEALRRLKVASATASTELTDLQARGTKSAVNAFERLNTEIRNTDGTLKPFPEILGKLKENLSTLEQGDKDLLMNALFGVQGGRTIESLLGQTEEKLNSVTVAMQNSSGSARLASEQLTQGLGPSLTLLGSSFSLASQKIGEFLSVGVTPLVQGATGLINAFVALPPAIQLPIVGIGALTAAITSAIAVIAAYEVLQIRSKAALFLSAAASIADGAAKTLQTGATVAASAAEAFYATQLNLSSIGAAKSAVAAGGLAVAKGILAAATGTATTAMLGFLGATLPIVAPVALLAGTVGLLVDTFLSVGKAANDQKKGLGDFDKALAKLDETKKKNIESASGSVSQDALTVASNKRVVDSIGPVQRALDSIRGSLNWGTQASAASYEFQVAFDEVLATADTVQNRMQDLFSKKDLTKVSTEEIQNLNAAILASKSAIEQTIPLDSQDAKAKELRIKSLKRLEEQLKAVEKAKGTQDLKAEAELIKDDPAKTARLAEINKQLDEINTKEKRNAEIQQIQAKIIEAKTKLTGNLTEAEKKAAEVELQRLRGELDRVSGGAKTTVKPVKDKDEKITQERAFEDAKRKREEISDKAKQDRQDAYDSEKEKRSEAFENRKVALSETRETAKEARQERFEARKKALTDSFEAQKEARALAFSDSQKVAAESFEERQRTQKEAFEERQRNQKEAFEERQRGQKEAFEERLEATKDALERARQERSEAFSKKQTEDRKKFDKEIEEEQEKLNRKQQLRDAKPEDRAKLQKQFKEEDKKEKEQEPIDKKKEEFEKKQAEEKKAEEKRVAEEKKAEEKRLAEEKKAEEKRLAEEKRVEEKRLAEEKRAEDKRIADEKLAEDKRIAAEKRAEDKRNAEEDRKQAAQLKSLERAEKVAEKAIEKAEKAQDRAAEKQFKDAEKAAERTFKEQEQQKEKAFKESELTKERAFKDEQRAKDEASAEKQKSILESTQIPSPNVGPGGSPPIPRFTGGPGIAGVTYIAGERGPEIFVPQQNGYFLNREDTMRVMNNQKFYAPSLAVQTDNRNLVLEIQKLQRIIENRNPKIETKVTLESNQQGDLTEFYRTQRAILRGII
jgi:TP901 family phage tail tape measure protein